ncbi:MAG: FAD-dependent oxidoreductase [Pseudomonadota bacterium]
MTNRFDAVVIGGGPAGASAAILLAQAGWSVALVEKQQFPRRKVCGECIAATNLELLDALGIGTVFHATAGAPLRKVALIVGQHTVHAQLPPLQTGTHAWGKALGREHLDTLLVARAAQVGVTVLQPWNVRSITGKHGDYRCEAVTVDSGQAQYLHTPIVIAAHGSWELAPGTDVGTREGKRPAKPDDLFAFKANFTDADLAADVISVLAFQGGYGGMVLGEEAVMTLACCVRRDRLAAARQENMSHTAAQAVHRILTDSCDGVRRALAPAEQVGSWLSTGPIRPGIRQRKSNNVFLIGNAAGEAHPIVGEGMSMALQSAWLLTQTLIAQRHLLADETAFRRVQHDYVDRWHACFAQRIRLAALFAHTAMRPHIWSKTLPVLQRWPSLLTMAARYSGKSRPIYPAMPKSYLLSAQPSAQN